MSCFVDLRQVPSRLLLDRPAVVHGRTGGPSRTRHPRAARRSTPRAAWSTPLGRLRPRPRVGTAHYESEEVLSMRVIKARRGLGVCAGAWLAISAFLLMAGAAGRGNPNRRVGRSRDPRRRSPRPRPRVSRQTDSSRRLPRTAPARPLQGPARVGNGPLSTRHGQRPPPIGRHGSGGSYPLQSLAILDRPGRALKKSQRLDPRSRSCGSPSRSAGKGVIVPPSALL